MQESGWGTRRTQKELRRIHEDDHPFEGGAILGSMCTQPHPAALDADALFATTNLGDPDHFPGTARMEREVLDDLADLLHAPHGAAGRFLTGGTEANLWAMYVAREKTGRRTVVVPEHAHFSFEKAARLLGMTLHWVPSGPDHRLDVAATLKAVGKDTALVVAVAGGTELGLVDPVAALAAGLAKKKVLLHVDAAFGGYVLPFLDDAPSFDFLLDGVWSVSLDPHKMGQATIPAGVLMLRDGADWDHVAVATPYVSTPHQAQLLGTRPGAAVAATWAVHRALGRDGYRLHTASCFTVRDRLVAGLAARGFDLVAPPELNVVTFRTEDPLGLRAALDAQGLRVNVVPRFGAVRIVVGPHVTAKSVDRLLAALEAS